MLSGQFELNTFWQTPEIIYKKYKFDSFDNESFENFRKWKKGRGKQEKVMEKVMESHGIEEF